MKFFFPLLSAALFPAAVGQEVISVHGSGTTNPQKCYWDIMDKLMKQSKVPIRLTYRGIGSSSGQAEFIGAGNGTDQPYNDFGSGDIPLDQEDFEKFEAGSILHLPIMMGAISVFHSVPTKGKELELTPCVLAKIFNRDITDWGDDEIRTLNPDLDLESPFPIKVARRVAGSSSTSSITAYLNQVCPEVWTSNLVGSTINWKTDTLKCEGSGGMTDCIRNEPGVIGYIEAGHGLAEGLQEVALENLAGIYLTSKQAAERGGITAAATPNAGIPSSLDQSFAGVNLLNQPGDSTWPIVALTYVYVRKDLLPHMSPASANLLKGFLTALYMDEYMDICAEEFGFFPIVGDLRQKAQTEIANLNVGGAEPWFFELSTTVGGGQGDSVFSVKRDSWSELEQDNLVAQVAALQARLDALTGSTPTTPTNSFENDTEFERDEELTAALALGAASFTLWVFALICFIVKYVLHV